MSFIVKGIDLPKHYEAVEIKVYIPIIEGYTKCTQEVSALFSGEDLDNIIQIPEDHGRLIDGDAFIRTLQGMFCTNCEEHEQYGGVVCGKCFITDTVLAYADFPTILEAEGGVKGKNVDNRTERNNNQYGQDGEHHHNTKGKIL